MLAYPIDTGNLETKGSTSIIGTVEVITHDQNDIKKFSEALGSQQIRTRLGQQSQTLHRNQCLFTVVQKSARKVMRLTDFKSSTF